MDLNYMKTRFRESMLRSIVVDERGAISNWPPGFLTLTYDETGLRLDALMGRRREVDDE
jgi:hypothetical protein